jgi:endothelin-converting enzyme/putative endopeptidase
MRIQAHWRRRPRCASPRRDLRVVAAILQPPFFDANADPAANCAETGAATIGHEMGHGFDDEGRQFDEKGRLRACCSKETAAQYIVQADRYEPIAGVKIKGQLALC